MTRLLRASSRLFHEIRVMGNDKLAVRGSPQVYLDSFSAGLEGLLKCNEAVFRIVQPISPVRRDKHQVWCQSAP